MRKNKLISPSSKPLLKINNLDVPKNKLQLSSSCHSLTKSSFSGSSFNEKKLLSPRNFARVNKISSNVVKSSESDMKRNPNSMNDSKVKIVCENKCLIQKLQLFGVKNSTHFLHITQISQYAKSVENLQKLIILSTLEDFTSIYIQLITGPSINVSSDHKGLKHKIKWIILCDAINSKNIEASFKDTYKQVSFWFVNSIFSVINFISLAINNVIKWETSKDKFTLLEKEKGSLKITNPQQSLFEYIFHLNFSQDDETTQNLAFLQNHWICIRQKLVTKQDQIQSDLKVNSVYFCSTKKFQKFFKDYNSEKSSTSNFIFVNNLENFKSSFSQQQIVYFLARQGKFYFFHLFENLEQEINNIVQKNQHRNIYQLQQRQKELIHKLQNLEQNLFLSDSEMQKFNLIEFNLKETYKIMINFEAKSQISSVVFIILRPDQLDMLQNALSVQISPNSSYKMIFLVLNEQINPQKFTEYFKNLCRNENTKIPQFFILQHNQMKIQSTYLFEEILLEENMNFSKLKTQIFRRVNNKKLFMNETFKDISKKISIYVLESHKIEKSNQFISELCHFLGINIKTINENDITLSLSQCPIKQRMEQTKNKINILFGKIQTEIEKNEIFRSFLVIYLPKMQKLSMEKLLSTISKAYEKYFNLIDKTEGLETKICFQLSLNIFNIPNLSLISQSQSDTSQVLNHFRLNQFQQCLKNIPFSSRLKKSSVKRIFFFIFQMDQFQEEFEVLIDNARMKNDCEIEIYLKYGEQFIHRPKNGKYNFMKASELQNLVHTMIQKSKKSQQRMQENFEQDEKKNQFQQINRLINTQSSIQESPRKRDSFLVTPAKAEEKSTYSAQNFLIESIMQQDPEDLKESSKSIHLFESRSFANTQKNIPLKLYVFVHKTMPLKCLINRNQADYEILTYNLPNEPLLIVPYLSNNEFVVVFKTFSSKAVTKYTNNSSNKSYKTSLDGQKMSKNFKVVELKEMGEHQVTKIIDSLVYKMKLKKILFKQLKKFSNQVPLIVYQTENVNDMNKNRLNKIRSLVNLKKSQSKDRFDARTSTIQGFHQNSSNKSKCTSSQEIGNEYFLKSSAKKSKKLSFANTSRISKLSQNSNEHMFSFSMSKNQAQQEYFSKKPSKLQLPSNSSFDYTSQSFQEFMMKFKAKTCSSGKYFLTTSDNDFVKMMQENSQKLIKAFQSVGISLYFLGQQQKLRNLYLNLTEYSCLNFNHLTSPKELLLRYFDPYIKPFDKSAITNKFKLSVSHSLILFRLIEEQSEKKKIPERLWNLSNRSQKTLSNTSLKTGSASNLSHASSSTSLKQNVQSEYQTLEKPYKPSPVVSYYYSKQLTKEKPIKNHINMFSIVGSSGVKEIMKRENLAFKKIKVNEYFTCVQDLMTILWQNGEKKYFMIVLMTREQLQDFQSNIFFVENFGLNLSDVIILQAKQISIEQEQNETVEYLNLLMKMDQQTHSCVMERQLKHFEETIEQIQAKIQHYVGEIIMEGSLLDNKGFETKLKEEIIQQYKTLLNYSRTDQKICAIICFVEDYEYLRPLIDSVIYKQDQSQEVKLILRKVDSIQEALNLNTQLMIPRCLIIPSEWWYLKISNGIMIDYNLEHFERKLGIFLNSMLTSFMKKGKFGFGKKG